MNELDLNPIKERESKAKRGPWFWIRNEEAMWLQLETTEQEQQTDWHVVLAFPLGTFGGHRPYDEDREFIASSREDVPALIAEVERLRQLVIDSKVEGFKAGFDEAKRCAADIAEMEADYYDNSKYKSDVMRNAVATHIKDLIKGLRHDLTYGEQELIKGIK